MTSLTVDTADLRQALQAVAPHADPDPDFPPLHRIRCDPGPDHLTITATQRYTAALAIVTIQEWHGDAADPFDLSPQDVKEILALFRGNTGNDEQPDDTIRLDVRGNHTNITDTSGMFGTEIGKALSLPRYAFEDRYPDIAGMVGQAIRRTAAKPSGRLVTSGKMLGLFGAAAKTYGKPLVLESGDAKQPLVLACGESFLGLLMPGQPTDEERAQADEWRAAWLRRLDVREPAPA